LHNSVTFKTYIFILLAKEDRHPAPTESEEVRQVAIQSPE